MTKKLSELGQGDMINHDGEIIYKDQAIKLIESGGQKSDFYTISPEWIAGALKSTFIDGMESDVYTAPDPNAELIEIDL